MINSGYVYILANRPHGAIYTGVTNNLVRRVEEHRSGTSPQGFTSRYQVFDLVWWEFHEDIRTAINRETCIKRWKRAWKVKLIEEENLEWDDLLPAFIALG